jgi:predicted extracellular nuclease
VGSIVTIRGIVVGDFQSNDADIRRSLQGFFVQEKDSSADTNPSTSEGIFVFQGTTSTTAVNVGDEVEVVGTVVENFGETQLGSIQSVLVVSIGNVLPTAAEILLPASSTTASQSGYAQPDLERYEGMLVVFPQILTVTEQFQLDRFNEIKLVQGPRPFTFTQNNTPSVGGLTSFRAEVGARTVTYDDGLNTQNQDIGFLDGFGPIYNTTNAVRMGDTITNLTGVLTYQWAGNSASGATWRVRSVQDGSNSFVKTNERSLNPPAVGGSLKLVSTNVLNYFTTLATTNALMFTELAPRGANNQAELDRQTSKLVTSILSLDADILGLVEIENDFREGQSGNAVAYLVNALNAAVGSSRYNWVRPGSASVGDDAISNAFIYNQQTVKLEGSARILDTASFVNDLDGTSPRNRPALAQSFNIISNTCDVQSTCITLAVNHFKSKGSACNDPDANDGSGNCKENWSPLLCPCSCTTCFSNPVVAPITSCHRQRCSSQCCQ